MFLKKFNLTIIQKVVIHIESVDYYFFCIGFRA